MATTPRKIAAADAPLTAAEFVGNDFSLAIPFAGLLADDSELSAAALTRDEWQARLDTYLTSPRP